MIRPVTARMAYGLLILTSLWGCNSSSSTPQPATSGTTPTTESPTTDAPKTQTSGSPAAAGSTEQAFWPDAPDVPFVPIMTEVDGIEIPRITATQETLQLQGAIPADVGNPRASKTPGEKVTGDAISIRFNSEPKVLNSIIESSAVEQYISTYLREGLARQNPETFEYEPHLASKWVAEDSIKLAASTPRQERRIAMGGGASAEALEFTYELPTAEDAEPPKVELTTTDAEGKPLANTWVGVYPVGRILGAPTTGYHQWSDAAGKVTLSGMPSGKYSVKVGAELFGLATEEADGSLKVVPGTPENPLTEQLKSEGKDALIIPKGGWADIQRETFYTFYLRPDVKWSDNTAYTTKDLEFSYAVINNGTVDGDSLRIYYADLIECLALTPHTVRMRYRQQYFKAFEFTTGLSAFGPPFHLFDKLIKEKLNKELTLERLTEAEEQAQNKVSAHGAVFGKFFNTDPVYNEENPLGTGPYVKGKWDKGDRLELNRNTNYWLPERAAYLDKIIVRFIPDNVTAMQAFKAGEIDFFWNMTPEQQFEDLKGPPDWFAEKYVKAAWYSPMFNYFGYNLLKPQFQDRRVRIALSLLFDKQDFLHQKLYDQGAVVSGSQYYFGTGYDHEVAPIGYDPETARDLLAEAGWVDTDNDGILDKDGLKMSFTLPMTKGNPVVEERVQLFQKSLKSVGIQLDIQFQEWASFIDKIRAKQFDICTLSWATPTESDPYQIWHSSGAKPESRGSNHVSFGNPLADELIEKLRVTLDEGERKRIHYSFHRLIDQEQPYTFLYCVKEFGAYHQRFRNVKWYRLRPGFDLTEWYVPKDEQIHK